MEFHFREGFFILVIRCFISGENVGSEMQEGFEISIFMLCILYSVFRKTGFATSFTYREFHLLLLQKS